MENAWVDGIGLEFFPEGGDPWYGTFASYKLSPNAVNGIWSLPHPDFALIISAGTGYVINVHHPAQCTEVSILPIMGVISSRESAVVLVWDYVRFICLDTDGLRWTSPRVSWDGIKEVSVRDGLVHALVWHAPENKHVQTRIDIQSGRVLEGAVSGLPE